MTGVVTDPAPVLNVELLDKVMAHIEALYEKQREEDLDAEWSQSVWRVIQVEELEDGGHRCKTAMCFAGWTVQLTGGKWVITNGHQRYANTDSDMVRAEAVDRGLVIHEVVGPRGGSVRAVEAQHRATRLLGLTVAERDLLFAGRNSLTDLRRIVAGIKAGELRR